MKPFARNSTAKDFFRALTSNALISYNDLTPQIRYDQARWAQRCRNFFWTASCPVPTAVPAGNLFPNKLIGMTPRFSDPVVVTDMLTMVDRGAGGLAGLSAFLQIFSIGGEHSSYNDDFFGLSGPIPQQYLLKHERDITTAPDRAAKWVGFVPRMIRPNQTLRVEYSQVPKDYPQLQIGFRGIRVLQEDNPYYYLTTDADNRIKRYTENSEPETFLMQVQATRAEVLAATMAAQPIIRRTLPQERPLLIMGCAGNVEGVQAALIDESKQYRFDLPDVPLNTTGTGVVTGYRAVPITLWAPNSELHNPEMYCMFPIPHLLAPGSVMRLEFTNGIMPDGAGAMTSNTTTRGNQDVRITFLCRTV